MTGLEVVQVCQLKSDAPFIRYHTSEALSSKLMGSYSDMPSVWENEEMLTRLGEGCPRDAMVFAD